MKRIFLMFVAALMVCTSTAYAQKVDAEGIKAKLAKSDADVAHAKKGTKAATWISRGDAYVAALTEPTKAIYIGIDVPTLQLLVGKPTKELGEVTLGGATFIGYDYPYFTAYARDGKIASWVTKKEVYKGAEDKAVESYNKAVELDASAAEKATKGLQMMVDYFKSKGNLAIEIGDMSGGANAYLTVAEIQSLPYFNTLEPSMYFYAGYMFTIDADTNPASAPIGEATLLKAAAAGYDAVEDANESVKEDDRGNIYYYLFHCAYAMRESDPSKMEAAKDYLQEGITKYPKNEKIFEGLLQLYTSEDGVGDPQELLETVESTIKLNTDNVNAWFGRGRIYFALKEYDECIASFNEVVRIDPDLFDGNFYLALFHMLRADEFLEKVNAETYTDQTSYNADIEKLNMLYYESMPYFEKAHELNPTDESTLDYLKQLCFRLRDMPGVMDKYTKYNNLYKELTNK